MASQQKPRRPRSAPAAGTDYIFLALADPSRRRILDLLRVGDRPVHTLAEAFDVSRPAISQHLRVLRDAGLVVEQRVGRERHYRLRAAALRAAARWIQRYEKQD